MSELKLDYEHMNFIPKQNKEGQTVYEAIEKKTGDNYGTIWKPEYNDGWAISPLKNPFKFPKEVDDAIEFFIYQLDRMLPPKVIKPMEDKSPKCPHCGKTLNIVKGY